MSKVDQIKALLEECSPDEQKDFLNYFKARFPHPLEREWGVSSDIILSAIARSPDLTKRGEMVLRSPGDHDGWGNLPTLRRRGVVVFLGNLFDHFRSPVP